jgi:hypothetical protein
MRTTIYLNRREEEKLREICGQTPISTCIKKLTLEKMRTADTDIQVKLYAILELIKEINEKVDRLEQKINNLH